MEGALNSLQGECEQDKLLYILRWLIVVPAYCLFLAGPTGGWCSLWVALFLGLFPILNFYFGIEVSVFNAAVAGGAITLFAIPSAILAYFLAPAYKHRVYQLSPILLGIMVVACQKFASDTPFWLFRGVPLAIAAIVPAAATFAILSTVVKPAGVLAALRAVFKDDLTELDKQVLTLQLGLLVIVQSSGVLRVLCMFGQTLTVKLVALVLQVLLASTLALLHIKYSRRLSQQGRDNSKLLNIINLILLLGTIAVFSFGMR